MAISTMLGRGPAFRNVVVNDLILDAEGQKMSKSKGNAVDPWDAVEAHGADAVRWYFITSSNPWVPKRYDPDGVKESARKLFDTLFNTYRFFSLDTVTREVLDELDGYQITRAYRTLGDFVVEDLSNWYVRRNRPRFWGNTDQADARSAFRTLHDALRTVCLLAAPCLPFTSDWLHRALTGESVHLQRYPTRPAGGERELEADMSAARTLVSLGRAAREDVKIRVRQPLRRLKAVVPGGRALDGEFLALIQDELNVKEVGFQASAEDLVRLVPRPNYRDLGLRFGKRTQEAADAIRALTQEQLAAYQDGRTVHVHVDGSDHALQGGDLEVVQEATGDLVVKGEGGFTVALDPALDDDLRSEGLARELVNRIQRLRRDAGLEITDRIELFVGGAEVVEAATRAHEAFIASETLAVSVSIRLPDGGDEHEHGRDVDLDGAPARIALRTAEK
jgi:isoleucyl-tRNA synthetase